MTARNPYRAAGTFRGVSYVERDADRTLLSAIASNSRFPYILAPRQSGKSSLLANVLGRLDRTAIDVAFVDLSTFLPECLRSRDAFFRGFFERCFEALGVSAECDPERWRPNVEAILHATVNRVLVALDEVDWLAGADFKESFFSNIRSTFNERAWVDEFERIQFVLAGAAHPSQLVENPSVSPFNISDAAIELTHLTLEQVVAMSSHLETCGARVSSDVPRTVYDHTRGSVYLTQLVLERLWTVGKSGDVSTLQRTDVDEVVQRIVIEAPDDVHFTSIRNAVMRDPELRRAVTRARGRSLHGKAADGSLRMTGLLHPDGRFANPVYERVFRAGQPLSVAPPDPERRQLTVMFCDIEGSTRLYESHDPESLRDVVHAYQSTCIEAIARHGGHVAQILGDGFLAFFGYPQAHEDDAENAIRAGLEIQRTMAHRFSDLAVSASVGIHTGLVVIGETGDVATREPLALGETVNLASRIQELGRGGRIVISEATLRLVWGRFETEELGERSVRGASAPLRLYEIKGPADVRGRQAAARALTPLIGREREARMLVERWESAVRGRGRVVVVSGPAGIGKSRIVRSLRDHIESVEHTWRELRCTQHHSRTPFHPVTALLEEELLAGAGASLEERTRAASERIARASGVDPERDGPHLLGILGLRPSLDVGDREQQHERTLSAIANLLLAAGARRPLVLAAEDLQWADPSTLALLDRLSRRVPTERVLLLLIGRTELESSWGCSGAERLVLPALTEPQAREMVAAVDARGELSQPIAGSIAERSDGVPLFIEELAKSAIEARAAPGTAALDVPATLRGALMARIDSLGPAKELVQLAATLGRSFSYELLEAVAETDPGTLERTLERIADARLLVREGSPPGATYTFQHALYQEAAYSSQLISLRRARHARVAEVLRARFPLQVASEPLLMARHCELGGLAREAVTHYRRAAEQATARSASMEAIGHLERALAIIRRESAGGGESEAEVDIRQALDALEQSAAGRR